MIRAHFAIPGDLASLTGGYAYDREVMKRASHHGVDLHHLALPGGFPAPGQRALEVTADALRAVPSDDVLIVDGLAFGAFPPALLALLPRRTIALVHHPLALETGIDPAHAQVLRDSEIAALTHVCAVIVTSETTADTLVSDYRVAREHIVTILPGTERTQRAAFRSRTPHILTVGSVVPRKGHDCLVAALADLADLDWSLTLAGSLARAPDHAARLRDLVSTSGLSSRVTLAGEVSSDTLAALYADADLFVMPSHYEGYGMVLAEAMVRGLPIVTTTGGALAHTVPDQAALKVRPGDVAGLRDALRQMIVDEHMRQDLAARSYAAGETLPNWDDAARAFAQVVTRVAQGDMT